MEQEAAAAVAAGDLPLDDRLALAVDYPAFVQDEAAALRTLGGEDAIAAARSRGSFLELRFRPGDVFSHPLYGDLQRTCNLLLRVRVKKRRKKKRNKLNHDAEQEEAEGDEDGGGGGDQGGGQGRSDAAQVESKVIARIASTFCFQGMADFQYVPDAAAAPAVERLRPEALVMMEEKDFLSQPDPMLIVPPIFSKVDIPQDYAYHGKIAAALDSTSGSTRVDFADSQAPSGPTSQHVQQAEERPEWVELLSGLFAERPIWSKAALRPRVPLELAPHLKLYLPAVAYVYGVDPRKDSKLRVYQMLDYRLPASLDAQRKAAGRRRALFYRRSDNRTPIGRYQSLHPKPPGSGALSQEDQMVQFEALHALQTLPQKKTTYIQLCDLTPRDIRDVVFGANVQRECTEQSGWYAKEVIEDIRSRITKAFELVQRGQQGDPGHGDEAAVAQDSVVGSAEAATAEPSALSEPGQSVPQNEENRAEGIHAEAANVTGVSPSHACEVDITTTTNNTSTTTSNTNHYTSNSEYFRALIGLAPDNDAARSQLLTQQGLMDLLRGGDAYEVLDNEDNDEDDDDDGDDDDMETGAPYNVLSGVAYEALRPMMAAGTADVGTDYDGDAGVADEQQQGEDEEEDEEEEMEEDSEDDGVDDG
eukprot:jgi/Chlat1/527/Chrsp103S01107